MLNEYKRELLNAVKLLDDTIGWLDNNEGNTTSEEDQNKIIEAVGLLERFINEKL